MDGRTKKYKKSIADTPEPILLSQMEHTLDLQGLISYAKEKGVAITELSEDEQLAFVKSKRA